MKLVAGIILAATSTSTFACSMTQLGFTRLLITSVTEEFAKRTNEAGLRDTSIESVRILPLNNVEVASNQNGQDVKQNFQVVIGADCTAKVTDVP